MTTPRNALDDDLLADLGITTTPPSHDPASADRSPATPPQAAPNKAAPDSVSGKTKRIGVDVSEEVWIATKIFAAQRGTTVADLIRSHLAHLVGDQG